MDFCKGGDVTVLDQGSNDGEVEAANFWGYLPGKVTANLNERGASDLRARLRQSRADETGLADVMAHHDEVQGAMSSFL